MKIKGKKIRETEKAILVAVYDDIYNTFSGKEVWLAKSQVTDCGREFIISDELAIEKGLTTRGAVESARADEAEHRQEQAAKRAGLRDQKKAKNAAFEAEVEALRVKGIEALAGYLKQNTGKTGRLVAQAAFNLTEKQVREIRGN